MMIDLEKLAKQLTYEEYIDGRDLFSAMKEVGIPTSKAAAMCYRAGYNKARTENRDARNKFYANKMAREAVEAATEGDNNND